MILCSKLKNGLWKIVTKSQVVTKSRLHCNCFEQFETFWASNWSSKNCTYLNFVTCTFMHRRYCSFCNFVIVQKDACQNRNWFFRMKFNLLYIVAKVPRQQIAIYVGRHGKQLSTVRRTYYGRVGHALWNQWYILFLLLTPVYASSSEMGLAKQFLKRALMQRGSKYCA